MPPPPERAVYPHAINIDTSREVIEAYLIILFPRLGGEGMEKERNAIIDAVERRCRGEAATADSPRAPKEPDDSKEPDDRMSVNGPFLLVFLSAGPPPERFRAIISWLRRRQQSGVKAVSYKGLPGAIIVYFHWGYPDDAERVAIVNAIKEIDPGAIFPPVGVMAGTWESS